jgi:hypothetical protein
MERFIDGMDLIQAGVGEDELTGTSPKRQAGVVPSELSEKLTPLFIQHGLDPGRPVRFLVRSDRDGILFSQ